MLEGHHFAQTDVRLLDDLRVDAELVKNIENILLEVGEAGDWTVYVWGPDSANVWKASNSKLVKTRIVIFVEKRVFKLIK